MYMSIAWVLNDLHSSYSTTPIVQTFKVSVIEQKYKEYAPK